MNYKKIVLFNFLGIVLVFIAIEIISFLIVPKELADYMKKADKGELSIVYARTVFFDYKNHIHHFRPVNKDKTQKRPIIFFGCSYTYGSGLSTPQTLPFKITELSGRTSYNRAIPGSGVQHMFYDLQQKELYEEVPDAEFIIYTFIYDHLRRMYDYKLSPFTNYNNQFDANIRYEIKNGELKQIKPRFIDFYSLYSVVKIQNYIKNKKFSKNQDDVNNLFLTTLKESKKITDKKYPNSKFIVILYKDGGQSTLDADVIKKIQAMGIIVIDPEKLINKKLKAKPYRLNDEEHPSEQAWNEIAPKLVKTLKL